MLTRMTRSCQEVIYLHVYFDIVMLRYLYNIFWGVTTSQEQIEFVSYPESFTFQINLQLRLGLVRALKEVKSLYLLGLCLSIPMEELQEIKSQSTFLSTNSAEECARKVLLEWMEREVTSWATLVRALNEVGATDLAYKIASKYSKHERAPH